MSSLTVVLLPGTGSDGDFVARAFAPVPAHFSAVDVVAVDPGPPSLIQTYLEALTAAAKRGPVVVCGVSIGAVVAAQWAIDHPETVAVIAAMPPWTGSPDRSPGGAPAASLAAASAETVERLGVIAATELMRVNSPLWLANELTRSWASHGSFLAPALREATTVCAPTVAQLRSLAVPCGIVGVDDDPVHPVAVARAWHRAIPGSGLATLRLDDLSTAPSNLGIAGLNALSVGGR